MVLGCWGSNPHLEMFSYLCATSLMPNSPGGTHEISLQKLSGKNKTYPFRAKVDLYLDKNVMGLESNTLPSQQSANLWATGQGGQKLSGGQLTVSRKVVGVSGGE